MISTFNEGTPQALEINTVGDYAGSEGVIVRLGPQRTLIAHLSDDACVGVIEALMLHLRERGYFGARSPQHTFVDATDVAKARVLRAAGNDDGER